MPADRPFPPPLRLYRRLLRLYPRPYAERFGEEMEQTVVALYRERPRSNAAKLALTAWIYSETFIGIIKEQSMQTLTKRLITWVAIIGGLLLIPLVLTLTGSGVDGDGWHWTPFDFVWASVVLLGAAFTYELVARKATTSRYKLAVAMAVLGSLAMVWMNGAVGIIGDGDNGSNLLYLIVLAGGLLAGLAVRFEARRLPWVLNAMAAGFVIVPIVMYVLKRPEVEKTPGVLGVATITLFFVTWFIAAGMLFRQASQKIQTT